MPSSRRFPRAAVASCSPRIVRSDSRKRAQPRTVDYPFTLIEIRFPKDGGPGVGKMSVYTKITMSKDKQTMELENYDIEPVRLTNVTLEK